jgi:hypothetical protein
LALGIGVARALEGMHLAVPRDHVLCDFHLSQFVLCSDPLKEQQGGGAAVEDSIVKLADMDSIQQSSVRSGASCSTDQDCHLCNPLFVQSIRNEYKRYGATGKALRPRELICSGTCEAMGAPLDVYRAGDFLRQLLLPCPKIESIPGMIAPAAASRAAATISVCNAVAPVILGMLRQSPTTRPNMSTALQDLEGARGAIQTHALKQLG